MHSRLPGPEATAVAFGAAEATEEDAAGEVAQGGQEAGVDVAPLLLLSSMAIPRPLSLCQAARGMISRSWRILSSRLLPPPSTVPTRLQSCPMAIRCRGMVRGLLRPLRRPPRRLGRETRWNPVGMGRLFLLHSYKNRN